MVVKMLLKYDNPGLDRELEIHNLFISHGKNGAIEVHAFGGPDAQEKYEKYVTEHGGGLSYNGTPNTEKNHG
jgi:hypothetical protein